MNSNTFHLHLSLFIHVLYLSNQPFGRSIWINVIWFNRSGTRASNSGPLSLLSWVGCRISSVANADHGAQACCGCVLNILQAYNCLSVGGHRPLLGCLLHAVATVLVNQLPPYSIVGHESCRYLKCKKLSFVVSKIFRCHHFMFCFAVKIQRYIKIFRVYALKSPHCSWHPEILKICLPNTISTWGMHFCDFFLSRIATNN